MKSLKKSLVLLVVLSMVLSVVAPVFAFNDAIPADYEDQVNKIAAMGIVTGDANGNFNAENDITRAEMAKIICRMTGITQKNADDNAMIPSKFSDVEVGAWYTGWINIATNNGIINGFPDGTFRPNDKLTENQALTLIVKALGRGVFVDKAGAWPGNYIQDAHTLGITKDMVYTESELANRGNVAILCYNALTVGTWGVVETRDGEIVSSVDDSLAAKYFQDYVASKKVDDNGTKGEIKYIKLLEDAVVEATALQDKDLGLRQIIIGKDDDTTYGANAFEFEGTETVAGVINASKAPRTDKEEATYKKTSGSVVAYVPEEVYAEVTSLNNKRIDVMFGDDNEVVMLIVIDDVVEDSYITAWDVTEAEIEIGGEVYEVNDDAVVTLYGYELTHAEYTTPAIRYYGAIEAIDNVIRTLEIATPNKVFNRTVKANIVLDEDGDIEKIDLLASQDFAGAVPVDVDASKSEKVFIGIEEDVVKSISSKGVIKGHKGSILEGRKIEVIEEDDEPRVIKDGAIASLEDIEVGDVVTAVYEATARNEANKVYSIVYVSSTKVEGTLSKVKNDAITIDGEVYNTVKGLLANDKGEIDEVNEYNKIVADPSQANPIDWKKYYNEDVELYLNHLGEVSAIVATTEATDLTVAVVTRNAADRDDNDKGVSYVSVKLLTKDGSKTTYKIYNKDDDEDFDTTDITLEKGDVVIFSADANGIIKSDKIHKLFEGDYVAGKLIKDLDGKDLRIFDVESHQAYDVKTVTSAQVADDPETTATSDAIDAKAYRFASSTVAFNVSTVENSEELGLIKKGWSALKAKSDDATFDTATSQYIIVDTTTNRIAYYFASVEEYAGTSNNYGLLVDVALTTDDDDEKIYTATLFVDGEMVSYELDDTAVSATLKTISSIKELAGDENEASEGQFVKYDLSNDKLVGIKAMAKVTTICDDKADEDSINGLIEGLSGAVKESLTVRNVVEDDIFFTDKATDINGQKVDEVEELVVDEDGCIIYDFREGSYEMFEGTVEDLEGLLVYGFAADCSGDYVDILIILD